MKTSTKIILTILSVIFFGYFGFLISVNGGELIDWVNTGLLVTILIYVMSIKFKQK